ncbi:MAG TPA: hypothetical protein VFF06_22795 [Polyangia bacterium]|nr:hypothetical protein [Polyangia bacterium]
MAVLAFAACSDNGGGGGQDLSVPLDGGGDAGVACGVSGTQCTAGTQCCSGVCDPGMHLCTIAMCGAPGAACTKSPDCCGGQCIGNLCSATACISDNLACTSAAQCCSNLCNGTCTPLNTTCKTAGNACTGDGECCGHSCINSQCAAPSQISYCTQVGDICFKGADCCTSVCTIAAGASVGTCSAISSTCSVDGTTCSGCTGCCSSLCAPFGGSGSHICQPASGCHVKGDLCQKNSDCCGGDPTVIGNIPGAGLVVCTPDPAHPGVGICSDPVASNCPSGQSCGNSCVPEGDTCHFKNNGGCSVNSVRNDCCACISGKDCCQLDHAGIPRCNAIATCVPTGGACADANDCCNLAPCVPDSMGHLHCGSMCVPAGGVCTTTADCCTGVTCIVPPGQLQGTCTVVNPPPPPVDGGTPSTDMAQGTCALYNQACSAAVPCCSGVTCRAPFPGSAPCAAGEMDCSCYELIP